MSKPEYYAASFSGGKDSTAMVLRLLELGEPLDEVVFCDTTMEFPALIRHVEKVKQVVEAAGVKFTTLRAPHDFRYLMLEQPIERKNPELVGLLGYSWAGPRTRWCTRHLKSDILEGYKREKSKTYTLRQYIGLAADEGHRLNRKQNQDPTHRHPLVEWGWTEADALDYCYKKGYDWEGLYTIFDRVSCWCCPLQPLAELRLLRKHFPDLWAQLGELDRQTYRNFKEGKSVEHLDKRFALEDALTEAGHSIKNRAFFADLRRYCAGEVSLAQILTEREASSDGKV